MLDTYFATNPGLAASATELDFGNVGVGASLTLNLDVANVGTVPVTAPASPSRRGFTATPVGVGTLAPGALQTVT